MIIHFHIQERRSKTTGAHARFDILPIKFSNNDDWDMTGLMDYPHVGDIYLVRTNEPRGKYVRVRSNYYLTPDSNLYKRPLKIELNGEWKLFKGANQ